MSAAKKATVYVDAEDEITAVIEQVVSAKNKIVALVLPRNAPVFQSSVNMKLLKKTAGKAQKNLVFITSDESILAIASTLGLHAAKTLHSKPAVPALADKDPEPTTEAVTVDAPAEGSQPDTPKEGAKEADADTITMDDADEPAEEIVDAEKKSVAKKLKVPDFSKFSVRLGAGVFLLFGLIGLWFYGFVVLPKATIAVDTNTSTVSIDEKVVLRVGEDVELDLEEKIVPTERVQTEKIDSVTVETTGEKDIGEKATGTATLTNCIKDDEQKVIPAGTILTKDNLNYLTSEQIILGPAAYVGNTCISGDFPALGAQDSVAVAAAESGSKYNTSSGTFTSSISGIRAFGSDMTGGTTEVIRVVSEEDVDNAKRQLSDQSRGEALNELASALAEKGFTIVEATLSAGDPVFGVTPAVDKETDQVTVTSTVAYAMLGIRDDDVAQLLETSIRSKLDDQSKNIRDNGLASVKFDATSADPSARDTEIGIQTIAVVGPEIDIEALKNDLAGKKRGDIESQLEAIEGVTRVEVTYSPMWITTTPKSADKLDIIINEASDL